MAQNQFGVSGKTIKTTPQTKGRDQKVGDGTENKRVTTKVNRAGK